MSRECYTYFLHWSNTDKSYYGVRYARECSPNDLWKTYFTSSKFVLAQRQLYGEPDIIQIRKTFGDDSSKAKLWEEKVLRRMNVVFNNKWLNQTNNNSFRGQDTSWNEGLTKENCPSLKRASIKISKQRTGKKPTEKAKMTMRISAEKRKRINSWDQLRMYSDHYNRYQSYEDFISDIIKIYESCWKIPSVIAKKLGVTERGVTTALSHNNLPYTKNQKICKVYNKYSSMFSSYEDYAIKIIILHNKNYTPYQISNILKINEWGVMSLLKSLNIVPNKSKPGPSKIGFQKILSTDTLEMMRTAYTFEDNPLSSDILVKLRNSISH